jgi:hypothetical protein
MAKNESGGMGEERNGGGLDWGSLFAETDGSGGLVGW